MGSISALAAAGDFEMQWRVVYGYENQQYSYNSSSYKTLTCNPYYDLSNPPSGYTGMAKHNTLYVQIYEQYTGLFGVMKWREYSDAYNCSYSNNNFSLSESVYLQQGTYGFYIFRPQDDYYYAGDGIHLGNIKISGNVKLL